jgi:hypothetical protein
VSPYDSIPQRVLGADKLAEMGRKPPRDAPNA